jgi:hypothetical protein
VLTFGRPKLYIDTITGCDLLRRLETSSASACFRFGAFDVIALDEVGYVPLADIGAEFLF